MICNSNKKRRLNIFVILILIIFSLALVFAVIWSLRLQAESREKAKSQVLKGLSIFMPKSEVSALLYDGSYIWAGGSDGVCLIDPKSGEIVRRVADDLEMPFTSGMYRAPDGSLWIAHEEGITLFQDNSRTDFKAPKIPGGRVNTVTGDGNNGVWAGTQTGTVHFTKGTAGYSVDKIITSREGLSEDAVSAITPDSQGALWFGSYLGNRAGGISILKGSSRQYFSVEQGLPHRYVTSILPLGPEHMLAGLGHLDRGGMALFKYSSDGYLLEDTYTKERGLPGEKVRQLYLDSVGHLWITSESDGLLICKSVDELKNEKLSGTYLTKKQGLSDNEIKVIIEAEGYYWLGGRYGLTRIEKGTIEELVGR